MSRVTYWVEYIFKYKYWDSMENDWCEEKNFNAQRFHCPKKDIKNEVRNAVTEELEGEKIKDLVIKITDFALFIKIQKCRNNSRVYQ